MKQAYHASKICKNCGKEYQVKRSHAHKTSYCSRECMAADYRTRQRGVDNPNFRNAGQYVCAHCGKAFQSYAKGRIYCGNTCRAASQRREKVKPEPRRKPPKQLALALPKPARDRTCQDCGVTFPSDKAAKWCPKCRYVEKNCIVCGTPFRRHRGSAYTVSTCSRKCASEYKSARQRGEKSHRWQGGRVAESMLFRTRREYDAWRGAVFARDDYTCQDCGKRGGRLCAHHIKRFSLHRELALEVWNGITICWPCHTKIRHHEEEHEARYFAITGGSP